jgi:hypothetical protein
MKKLYQILNIAFWCFLGIFIGNGIYAYIDYRTYPELYAMQSMPWYFRIQVFAVVTAVVEVILFAAMRMVKKKIQ